MVLAPPTSSDLQSVEDDMSNFSSDEDETVEDDMSDFSSDMAPARQAGLSDDGGVNTADMSPIQGMCILCYLSGFTPNTNP